MVARPKGRFNSLPLCLFFSSYICRCLMKVVYRKMTEQTETKYCHHDLGPLQLLEVCNIRLHGSTVVWSVIWTCSTLFHCPWIILNVELQYSVSLIHWIITFSNMAEKCSVVALASIPPTSLFESTNRFIHSHSPLWVTSSC